MIRTILALVGFILSFVSRATQIELIRYISLAIACGCLGSIVQEYIDNKKMKKINNR